MDFLANLTKAFSKTNDVAFKDEIAKALQMDKNALNCFEKSYKDNILSLDGNSPYLFDNSSKNAVSEIMTAPTLSEKDEAILKTLIPRIVNELIDATSNVLYITNDNSHKQCLLSSFDETLVTKDEIEEITPTFRPQLTSTLVKRDIDAISCETILKYYFRMQNAKTSKEYKRAYNLFRQGLDILDLDEILYEMLSQNPNSMSHWLPQIADACHETGFFKIPETKIVKVPLPILQLSRVGYNELTPATLKIVNDWAMEAFGLDVNKTYFVKTGTFSSKFDFRNAKVTDEQEVKELGSYLLYIQNLACQMAGSLTGHAIYGVSTTNEWVVREYIEDKEDNPCIYKGMPLHTEYRVFVDFDTNEVLGMSPYWEPEMMKKRFSQMDDAASPHQRHDYIIFKAHEKTLMERYNKNKNKIFCEVKKLLPIADLKGQWSIDIMQNGDDFYLIDMATADTSALSDCVAPGLIHKTPENWLPQPNILKKMLS